MSPNVGTVLLVIDEPVMLDLMRKILERAGYEVVIAGDDQEALGLLRTRHVGIVVTDMSMPMAGGEQFVEHVQEVSQAAILAISARREDERPSGTRNTIQGFLRMPFTPAELLSAVRMATNEGNSAGSSDY